MPAGMIFGVIIVFVFWYFAAKEFFRIAAMKGHDEARYFWWTFLFWPVGMLMVIALPNDKKDVAETKPSALPDELPDI